MMLHLIDIFSLHCLRILARECNIDNSNIVQKGGLWMKLYPYPHEFKISLTLRPNPYLRPVYQIIKHHPKPFQRETRLKR